MKLRTLAALAIALCSTSWWSEASAQILPTEFETIESPSNVVELQNSRSTKVNLGPAINTIYSELFPVITPDESVLFFTRKGSPDNSGYSENTADEDIWYAVRN
jgi:hypothetical protein